MKKHGFYIKTIAVVLMIVVIVLSFTGCSSKIKVIKPTEEDIKVVGNVLTVEIFYEELRYLTILAKETIENKHDISIWDNAQLTAQYKDELTETLMSQITANAAVVLLAKEMFGAEQASMDNEVMEEKIQQAMENFLTESFYYGNKYILNEEGEQVKYDAIDTYKQWLNDSYMTDHLVRYNIFIGLLETQLLNEYTSEEFNLIPTDIQTVSEAIMDEEKFARVMMIFIENDYGENVDDNFNKANEIRGKIAGGEDFEDYLSVSEDFNDTQKNYYYIPEKGSSYGQTVADAAFDLDIGELSEVVETSGGFYILKRIEKDEAKVLSDIALKGDLYNAYVWSEFYRIVDEYQDKLTFTFNDYGKSLDLTAIK